VDRGGKGLTGAAQEEVTAKREEDRKAASKAAKVAQKQADKQAAAEAAQVAAEAAQAESDAAERKKKKERGIRDRTLREGIALAHRYVAKLNALLAKKGGHTHHLTLTEVCDKAEPNVGGGFLSKSSAKSKKRKITITARGKGFSYYVGKIMKQSTDGTPASTEIYETAELYSVEEVTMHYGQKAKKRARRPTVNHHVGLPAIIVAGGMPTANGSVVGVGGADDAPYMDEEVVDMEMDNVEM
jgi:hypothetical protein